MTQPPHYPAQPPYNRQTPPASPGYPQAQPGGSTYPPNQTFPGQQPPQPGSTYPQTQPTSQPYPQQPATPPPTPKNNTTTGIITTMGALLIALTIAVIYLATTKNNPTPSKTPTPSATPTASLKPTPTPTPGRGWTINGNQLTATTMTAQLPPGWRISEQNGAGNDGDIIEDKSKSRIKYWINVPRTAEESCKKVIGEMRRSPNDTVESIPGQIWGGKPVLTYRLTNVSDPSATHIFHCLNTENGTSVLLEIVSWTEYKEQAHSAGQVLMTTWQWK